jgi:hypothetical protein
LSYLFSEFSFFDQVDLQHSFQSGSETPKSKQVIIHILEGDTKQSAATSLTTWLTRFLSRSCLFPEKDHSISQSLWDNNNVIHSATHLLKPPRQQTADSCQPPALQHLFEPPARQTVQTDRSACSFF